jgi:hypothetical protein
LKTTPPVLIVLAAMVIGLAGCSPSSQDGEYTDQQKACIAQRFPVYNAKKLDQCVDVCRACMNGNTVTCTTSCKLKGAS